MPPRAPRSGSRSAAGAARPARAPARAPPRHVLARDRVLHLGEPHRAPVGVDAMAGVEVLGAAHHARDEPVDRGIAAATPPRAAGQLERRVLEQHVADERRQRRRRAAGRGRCAREVKRQRRARVGEDEQLEVVVRRPRARRRRDSTSSSGRGSSMRWIVNAGTQRTVTARDRAERAERDPPGEQVVALAQSTTRRRPSPAAAVHLRRDVREAPAGAVGGGGDRAGHRLRVHVPLVLEREAARGQRRAELAIVMPASTVTSCPSTASTRFIRERSTITPSVQAMSVNEWPAPATLTRAARRRPRGQLGLVGGPLDALGRAALVARPVHPHAGHDGPGGYDAADSAAASTLSGSGPSAPRGRSGGRAGRPPRRARPCSPCRPRSRPAGRSWSVRSPAANTPGSFVRVERPSTST